MSEHKKVSNKKHIQSVLKTLSILKGTQKDLIMIRLYKGKKNHKETFGDKWGNLNTDYILRKLMLILLAVTIVTEENALLLGYACYGYKAHTFKVCKKGVSCTRENGTVSNWTGWVFTVSFFLGSKIVKIKLGKEGIPIRRGKKISQYFRTL
jgi:hypothetical protein